MKKENDLNMFTVDNLEDLTIDSPALDLIMKLKIFQDTCNIKLFMRVFGKRNARKFYDEYFVKNADRNIINFMEIQLGDPFRWLLIRYLEDDYKPDFAKYYKNQIHKEAIPSIVYLRR